MLNWKAPLNPNGHIYYYMIEWKIHNVSHTANVTDYTFKFPNTNKDDKDKLQVTVQAVGEGGIGIPLIIDPNRSKMYPQFTPSTRNNEKSYDPFVIFGIILISLLLLTFIVGYVLCRRHRYCKTSNGIINNEQSSFSPTTSPILLCDNVRSDEMYEMQTLIPTSQSSSILLNGGKDNLIKTDIPSNGDSVINVADGQNVLRTSTPTDEMTIIAEICDEPPIKCDIESTIQISDERKPNGFLKTFHSMAPAVMVVINKTPDKSLLKVNGNSSPYKSLQVNMCFFIV